MSSAGIPPTGCHITRSGVELTTCNSTQTIPSPFKKRAQRGSTFTRGSNIPGLSSDNAMQTEGDPKPNLPSSKVKDLGKNILERANRCIWYEGMIQQDVKVEESEEEQPAEEAESKDILPLPSKSISAESSQNDSSKKEEEKNNNDSIGVLRRLEEQQMEIIKMQREMQDMIKMNLQSP